MSSPSPAAAASASASASPATTSTSAPTSASASPSTTPSSASTPSKPKLNVAAKPWTPGSAAIPVPVPVTHATIPIPISVSAQPIIAPIHVNPNHHHTTSITTAPLSAVLSSPATTATAASVPPTTNTNTSASASASASKPKLRASASAFVPSFAKPTTPPSTTSSPASVAAKPNGVAHASPVTTATSTPTPTPAGTATTPATTPAAAPTTITSSTPTTPATTAPTPAAATPATSSATTTTTSTPATSTATSEDESRRKDSTASTSTSTSTPTLSASSKKSPALNPLIPKVDLPVVRARKPAAQRVRQAKVNDDDGDRDVIRDRSGSHVNADGDEEPIETTEKKEVISGFVPPTDGDHRKYDREFLMTFKDICLDPPAGLPDQIEGILRAASERRGSNAGMGADWRGATRAPTKLDGSLGPQNRYGMLRPGAGGDASRFPSSSSSSSSFRSVENRRQPSSGSSSIRPSSGARGSTTDTRRTQSSSQTPLVTGPIEPLAKSENRYQVMKDIPQDVKLLRSLNSILNKLTPEKFDLLVEKVMELDISTAALLRDCVTAVFEKALAEPNFSPTYAEFCVRLSERLPAFNADENDTKKSTNFKRLILNRCQQEFEDEADHTETMSKLPNDEEKEFFRIKMKRRTLGTIRFIGELFARSMLQAAIMKQCLVKLLGDVNAPVEEDIEALCKLLDTVGHLLDKDKHKEFLDLLYTNMKTLSTSKLLSSRIRFMLQDSIELRAKGWVARRKAEQAKKISDIRTEVKPTITVSEVTKIAPLRPANRFDQISSGSSLRAGSSRFADRYSFKKEPASSPKRNKNNSTGTDDWATVGSAKKWTGGRTPQGPLSPEKNSHQRQSSQAKSKEVEPVKPRGNAFDMLGDEDDHDQNDADEHEHEHDDENNADEKSSTATSTSTSTSTSTTVLSEDEVKSKVQSLLKEFFSVYDMNEATTCVTELGSVNIHHGVVLEGLLLMIEGKDKDREWFSKLLIHLYKEKIITREYITKAFDEMITLTEDISIDIPKTLEHLATVLSALIAADVVPLNYLNDAPLDTLNPGEGARLAILILQSLRKSRGDEDVVSIFKDAHLHFVSWLKDTQTVDAAKKLLNDKKLDVLVDHVSA